MPGGEKLQAIPSGSLRPRFSIEYFCTFSIYFVCLGSECPLRGYTIFNNKKDVLIELFLFK